MQDSTNRTIVEDTGHGMRRSIGLALLGLGVLAAVWTFFQVYGLLADPEGFTLVQTLAAYSPRDRSIVLPEGTIEVPPVFVKIGAYGTAIGFLAICAGIANTLVKSGTHLLQPSLDRLLRQWRDRDSSRGGR
jgi:hypothetical protein